MIDMAQADRTLRTTPRTTQRHWLTDYAVICGKTVVKRDLDYTQAVRLCNTEPTYRVIKNANIPFAIV